MDRVLNSITLGKAALACLLALSAQVVCFAGAQAEEAEKKSTPLPQSGSLSTSMQTGNVNNKIPDVWGGNDPSGEKQPPVSGSVSRKNADTWIMRVFNTSEDTYSVDLEVVQFNERGAKVKGDFMSYVLKPGVSKERELRAGLGAREAQLNLRRYRKFETKKPQKKTAEAPSDAASPDIEKNEAVE
jgi:hypothetical protein